MTSRHGTGRSTTRAAQAWSTRSPTSWSPARDHEEPGLNSARTERSITDRERIAATREFFAPRAATWNDRFREDGPAFSQAVEELAITRGGVVLDVGCGAGRAFADLRRAVGRTGRVVGLDVTPEMVAEARTAAGDAVVLIADGESVPFRDHVFDAIFAAGLVQHLADPVGGLAELARVTRPGGGLAIFHPVGRAVLARKHGRELRADDPLDPAVLPGVLAAGGWACRSADDGTERYLVIAERV